MIECESCGEGPPKGAPILLAKYEKLVARCRPYAVLNDPVRPNCDLSPLGLEIAPEHQFNPFSRSSNNYLDWLAWLDRKTFGLLGMEMPRWVLYDCSEMPGGICGFCMPFDSLPRSMFQGAIPKVSASTPVPVSMAIAIPVAEKGGWLKHTLCSINEISHQAAPPGLRTITFAMALAVFKVKTLYSTLQWRSSELRIHVKFGDLELLTAYTPAHTEPRTLTYRLSVEPEGLQRGLAGKTAYRDAPSNSFYLEADDVDGMIELQHRIEAGERIFVCGRPIRDGSSTFVPLRTNEG